MPSKYILHGGSAQKINTQNDLFFQEILKDTPNNLNILLVHFAVLPENMDINYQKDSQQFLKISSRKHLTFQVADHAEFINQIINSDIIYFSGGVSSQTLIDDLSKYPNLCSRLSNKIVAGESAGANCLVTWGYSPSVKKYVKGLGIIPINLIPHFETDGRYPILKSKFKLLKLPAFEYKVFIKYQ